MTNYTGPSIEDYLSSVGKDKSFVARKLLAEQMGVQNYTGTGSQNTQLLNSLRHLLTKPETAPQERSLVPANPIEQNARPLDVYSTNGPMPNGTAGSHILTTPKQISANNIQGQVGQTGSAGSYLYGTPRSLDTSTTNTSQTLSENNQVSSQPSPTQPSATDLFNKTLEEMMKAAQSAGNEDLMAKRNAIIQARFNAGRNTTPEELRVLSPQAQASLRNLDQSGLEDQLSGINTAIQGRETRLKNEQATRQGILDNLLKKQQDNKPISLSAGQTLYDPTTGKAIFTAPEKPSKTSDTPITKIVNKQLLQYNPDTKKWDVVNGSGKTPIATTKKPVSLKTAENDMIKQLNAVVGADGFISPQDDLKAVTAWQNKGYNATDYYKFTAKYRNPNNPNYVIKKQPTKTSGGRSL